MLTCSEVKKIGDAAVKCRDAAGAARSLFDHPHEQANLDGFWDEARRAFAALADALEIIERFASQQRR